MNSEFDPPAEQEFIESIRRYLAEAGPLRAVEFDNEVKRVVGLLLALPKLGTPGARGTRSIPLRRYPYSLHYRLEPDLIRIRLIPARAGNTDPADNHYAAGRTGSEFDSHADLRSGA